MNWEYMVAESRNKNLQNDLNVLGSKGWELANTYFYGGRTLIFKKLVED